MSIHVLGEVAVGDLDQFLQVFTSAGHEKRVQYGCRSARAFRPSGECGRVLVLTEWPDLQAFDAFRNDPDARTTMVRGSGRGVPTFTVLDQVADLPG